MSNRSGRILPPELRRRTEEQVQELGESWKFPVPPPDELADMASLEGVDEDRLRLLYSRATPQPFGTYTQPLHLKNPSGEELPKLGYEAWNTKPSSSRTLGFRAYLGSDETTVEVTRVRQSHTGYPCQGVSYTIGGFRERQERTL
jgi:hypothetical protein